MKSRGGVPPGAGRRDGPGRFSCASTPARRRTDGPRPAARLGLRVPPAARPVRGGEFPADDPLRPAHELSGGRRRHLAAALRSRSGRCRPACRTAPRRRPRRSSEAPRGFRWSWPPERSASRACSGGPVRPRRRGRGRPLRRRLPRPHPLVAVRPHRPARRASLSAACCFSFSSCAAGNDRTPPAMRRREVAAGTRAGPGGPGLAGGDLLGCDRALSLLLEAPARGAPCSVLPP